MMQTTVGDVAYEWQVWPGNDLVSRCVAIGVAGKEHQTRLSVELSPHEAVDGACVATWVRQATAIGWRPHIGFGSFACRREAAGLVVRAVALLELRSRVTRLCAPTVDTRHDAAFHLRYAVSPGYSLHAEFAQIELVPALVSAILEESDEGTLEQMLEALEETCMSCHGVEFDTTALAERVVSFLDRGPRSDVIAGFLGAIFSSNDQRAFEIVQAVGDELLRKYPERGDELLDLGIGREARRPR